MKKTIACITLIALFPAGWASADTGYINYRHQYAESTRMHADRVKFGTRLDSGWGFEGELKYKTAGDRQDVAFDNTVGSGHELTTSYQYRLNSQWMLTPSFALESIEKSTAYKMGLKATYKVTDALSVAGRYRYDAYINYAPKGPWAYEYQLTYYDADYIRYDSGKKDYEQNAVLKYKWDKHWVPFVEVGDMKVDAYDDERQLRLRVGVQYNFL